MPDAPLPQNYSRYHKIVERQTELICCYRPDSIVTYVNPAYGEFFGVDPQTVVGSSILQFFDPDQHERILAHIHWQVVHKTPRFDVQYSRSLTPPPTLKVVEWTDQPLFFDDDGNVTEIIAVGRDATERIRAEETRRLLELARLEQEALRSALEKERELNLMRANLMRVISHEFRTPLAIMRSSSDILTRYDDRLGKNQRIERLTSITEQVTKMNDMLDDIAESLSSGTVRFEPTEFDLESLTRRLINEYAASIGAQHVFNLSANGVSQVRLDQTLVVRMLSNLISNAVKYSPPHTEIDVELWAVDQHVMMRVRDRGIGIPQSDQTRLFEPFYRGSNVGSVSGTGIGMAIIRDCLHAHNGTISVESEVGQGSVFTITLPMADETLTKSTVNSSQGRSKP